jgi:hypothetical protein
MYCFTQIPRLLMEDPLQQDVVFSRFCAMYLPELVEHYLDPPEPSNAAEWNKSVALEDMKLANAYGYLLVHLNGNPYFDRFFRLPKHRDLRVKMINALLDRLYERAPAWEQREAARDKPTGGIAVSSLVYDYCQLLSAIMLFELEEVITNLARSSKVQTLLNFLDWWEQRYNPKNASKFGCMPKAEEAKLIEGEEITSGRSELWSPGTLALIIRNGSTEKERDGIRQARHLKSSLHTCGLPGCNRGFAKDGGSLLQCSQCSTVRYVRSWLKSSGTKKPY